MAIRRLIVGAANCWVFKITRKKSDPIKGSKNYFDFNEGELTKEGFLLAPSANFFFSSGESCW